MSIIQLYLLLAFSGVGVVATVAAACYLAMYWGQIFLEWVRYRRAVWQYRNQP